MQLPRLFLLSMLVMTVSVSYSQSKGEFSGPYPKAPEPVPEPTHKTGVFSPRRAHGFKMKRRKVIHSAQYEFYERVEKAAKAHMKALKEMSKPQYSNFLYYGHKRKPKKHSADKMRYCPECGI